MNSEMNTKATLQQRVSSLISGAQKHYPTGTLMFGGASYDAATLIQTLQGLSNAIAASDVAKAKWKDALKSEQDENAKVGPIVRAFQSFLVSSFGNTPSTLADFGLTPRKVRAPATAEEMAAAVAKRQATRTARNTMGSVQRKKVKGNVTSVVVTPIVAGPPVVQSPATTAPAPTAGTAAPTPHIA
jgi:hypothetical protein